MPDLLGRPLNFPKLPLLLPFSLVSALLSETFLQRDHQPFHYVFCFTSHEYLIHRSNFSFSLNDLFYTILFFKTAVSSFSEIIGSFGLEVFLSFFFFLHAILNPTF